MVEITKENILKIKPFFLVFFITFGSTFLFAEHGKKNNIDMFPKAKEGFERHVVKVPESQNDRDHRIELLIGKNMMVDCNHHSFSAEIKSINLQGLGYRYLKVDKIQSGPTTLMACPGPKTEKFISIPDKLRRYNSRLPLVIYVPKGYEVRYRIWSADKIVHPAQQR
jgi:ecotin